MFRSCLVLGLGCVTFCVIEAAAKQGASLIIATPNSTTSSIGFPTWSSPCFQHAPLPRKVTVMLFVGLPQTVEDYRKPKYPRIKSTTTTTPIM